mmetsp:Transcript_10505/g.33963  ORF Transcript_10505/g.33963 Transcript_10505/m.33963 type:complete len:209 (+) Transcript_10505:640-1266(+)
MAPWRAPHDIASVLTSTPSQSKMRCLYRPSAAAGPAGRLSCSGRAMRIFGRSRAGGTWSIFDFWSWKKGTTHDPQLHCSPAQLNAPRRAPHAGLAQTSFPSWTPSQMPSIHRIGSQKIEEQSLSPRWPRVSVAPLTYLSRLRYEKAVLPSPLSWSRMLADEARRRRHLRHRYSVLPCCPSSSGLLRPSGATYPDSCHRRLSCSALNAL